MKYLKTIIFEFIILITLTLITTILYYFDLTSSNANNIFKIISFVIIFVSTGIYIGKNSNKKGWFEGLKISGINILLFLIIALLFKYDFNIKQFIYYLISSFTVVLGSMIGINFRKKK
ncbi:MAG: TIGR04086 family membrane protein [Bacilli bacterium]|nr:TIGR04086 family membrane protein [Bacilli bacterium]